MLVKCKRCGSTHCVRNGKVRGKQRYKCKECGFNFVEGDNRQKIGAVGRALAILLYGSGNVSYGFIARLFGVSRTTVLRWIRQAASCITKPVAEAHVKEVEIDEMWHFIGKKSKKYGYGERWTVLQIGPSDGILALVLLKPLNSSTVSN